MRPHSLILLLVLGLAIPLQAQAQNNASIEVAFSPNAGAAEAIVDLLGEAKETIRVAAYSFTSKPIAQAMLDAHKRGVDVRVVLDSSNNKAKYSSATFLANSGIPTRINSRYAIMHNKYMIVDGLTVQTGSFNYSRAAEAKNAENILILRQFNEVADQYNSDWQRLWDEAKDHTKAIH
jgi:phosphatidylserine/phosphatidylglycerophosphate/cardiolipin synthase-like enzyme